MWQEGHLTVNHKMDALGRALFPPRQNPCSRWRRGDGNGWEGIEASQCFNSFKNRAD